MDLGDISGGLGFIPELDSGSYFLIRLFIGDSVSICIDLGCLLVIIGAFHAVFAMNKGVIETASIEQVREKLVPERKTPVRLKHRWLIGTRAGGHNPGPARGRD